MCVVSDHTEPWDPENRPAAGSDTPGNSPLVNWAENLQVQVQKRPRFLRALGTQLQSVCKQAREVAGSEGMDPLGPHHCPSATRAGRALPAHRVRARH